MVLLAILAGSSTAGAEPLPSSCRTGLVLGVAESEANDVVASVCSAAKRRGTSGAVRVSVLSANDRVRVGIARQIDTTEMERAAHVDAGNIAEALRFAPSLVESVDPNAPAAPLASASAPAPPNDPTSDDPAPKDQPPKVVETKAGPPAAWIGAHGSSGVAAGGSGLGGGAAVGIDHRNAQGFIDYSNSSASTNNGKFEHQLAAIGARLKLSRRPIKPVIGGGWSYVDYDRGDGAGRTQGQGIGVFGETGVLWEIGKHQIMAIARANIGIYEEKTTRPYSYTGINGQRVDTFETSSGRSGALTPTLAFMAGYAYVFR